MPEQEKEEEDNESLLEDEDQEDVEFKDANEEEGEKE